MPEPPGPVRVSRRRFAQELEQLGELALSADQLARLGGQVGLVQAAKTRELALPELVEPHRLSEVLQPVLAQIPERRTFDQLLRGLGDEDLPPVPGRADAGGAMDVHADVALVRNGRLPRVDAHPNRELEPALRLLGRGQRVGGPGEGDEERVALCVDLDAAVTLERLAQHAAVLFQQPGVGLPVLAQQPGRAFDVREQEGDGAGRELHACAHHVQAA